MRILRIRLLSFLFILIQAPLTAEAFDAEASTGVFYFPGDEAKVMDREMESAEGGQKFHAKRDYRVVARELAREEIQHGNICLKQAQSDLEAALKSKQILKLCHKIYQDDLAIAATRASKNHLEADFFRCSANMEAREANNSIKMMLSFRGQLVMLEKVPKRLKKAGFKDEEKGWALPTHEAPLGEVATGWKGVLKNGSCTLDKEALDDFLKRYLAQRNEEKALVRCKGSQVRQADLLVRLQKQFKEYVPDEWMKDSETPAGELMAPPSSAELASLKMCKKVHASTRERLEKLREASARLASKHDVPALDPKNQASGRSLASEDEEF